MKKRVLKNRRCTCINKCKIKIFNKYITYRAIHFLIQLIREFNVEALIPHVQKNFLLLLIKKLILLIFNI